MPFLSDRLAEARVAAGLTQQQLADALGVSKPRVSEWERGHTEPRASRLPAVARAVGVDPLQLVAEDYDHLDLEALRMAAGLSRQDLAAAIGMTLPRYQRLESGERASDPPDEFVPLLARVLSVPEVTVRLAADNAREQRVMRQTGRIH